MRSKSGAGAILAIGLFSTTFLATAAPADVVISSDATQNMNCAAGVCAPTATDAVLNVTDLEDALAAGNLEVTTTGSGVQAKNIVVSANVSWSTSNTLALDAYNSIEIDATIADGSSGGLSLTTSKGGRQSKITYDGGNIIFAALSSNLTINGKSYQLAGSISSLAADIAAAPKGKYALANSYDASADGTYSESPIPTVFSGIFDGLGNSISNLSISSSNDVGLFYEIAAGGVIRNIVLTNVNISEAYTLGWEGLTLPPRINPG